MRVLIIGCGYVGTALGAELVRHGHSVWGNRRTNQADGMLKALGIAPLHADVTTPATLSRLAGSYDWVVNCVSASGGGAAEYERVYLLGTSNLIASLSTAPLVKFVYTSSTSVYGQTDGNWVDETSPTASEVQTSAVLLRTEELLLSAAASKLFPSVVLRVAGIYGPGRAYWLEQVRSGAARVEGTGDRVLNMIHRDDVVGAIIAALARGKPGRIYNAVDDEPVSQLTLLQWLSSRLHCPLPPAIAAHQSTIRKRGLTSKRVSNQRLKSELGYQFKFPTFREGFELIVQP